jgi:hypothetical protein
VYYGGNQSIQAHYDDCHNGLYDFNTALHWDGFGWHRSRAFSEARLIICVESGVFSSGPGRAWVYS